LTYQEVIEALHELGWEDLDKLNEEAVELVKDVILVLNNNYSK
jgi:hypothetical protein